MTQNTTLVLYTDGGSRGNPGPASAGMVISDKTGRKLYAAGRYLGQATNNVAEYHGLIYGMQQAVKMEAAKLEVYTDSELMVRQIKGIYKVKNEKLKPLYEQVIRLIEQFESVKVTHVRREKNKLADEMANLSMDKRGDVIRNFDCESDECDAEIPDETSEETTTPYSVRLTAQCSVSSKSGCPAVMKKGLILDLPGFADGNLCMYAVAAIVDAYLASDGESFTARCAKPGCGAVFKVAVSPL